MVLSVIAYKVIAKISTTLTGLLVSHISVGIKINLIRVVNWYMDHFDIKVTGSLVKCWMHCFWSNLSQQYILHYGQSKN